MVVAQELQSVERWSLSFHSMYQTGKIYREVPSATKWSQIMPVWEGGADSSEMQLFRWCLEIERELPAALMQDLFP